MTTRIDRVNGMTRNVYSPMNCQAINSISGCPDEYTGRDYCEAKIGIVGKTENCRISEAGASCSKRRKINEKRTEDRKHSVFKADP